MLKLQIPEMELFDNATSRVFTIPKMDVSMEHSLVAISDWESKWKKPFLTRDAKTREEAGDYFWHMTLTPGIPEDAFQHLPNEITQQILSYIQSDRTATTIADRRESKGVSRSTITSEVLYYQMIALGIPIECERWHLSRLMTLMQVVNIKSSQGKDKRPINEVIAENTAENERRKALYNTNG